MANANSFVAGGTEENVDPYFVSNSDNPTSSLTHVLFNGSNFMRWGRNVRRAWVLKTKMGFIDGSIKEPNESDKEFFKWKRADYTWSLVI